MKERIFYLSFWDGLKEIFRPKKVKKMTIHFSNIKKIATTNVIDLLKNVQSYILALALIRKTDIEKNDLIFAYWLTRSTRIAFYVNSLIGNDYICQGHGSDIYIYPPEDINNILSAALKVITVGEKNKKYMCSQFHLKEDKIVVFRQGVAKIFVGKMINNKGIIKKKSMKVFLTVGNYERVKGISLLLEAIRILARKTSRPNKFHFEIYGEGSEFNEYKKKIVRNNLSEYVSLNGWISREELAGKLKSVDCYILPSISEGLPNVLMEACSASLPIIASNVGSVSEIAKNGENAILIDNLAAENIANAILEFMEFDEEKLMKMSRKSYEIYEGHYKLEENLKEKYEYIQKLF